MGIQLSDKVPTVGAPAGRQGIVSGWLLVFVVTLVIRCGFATYTLTLGPSPFTAGGRNLQAAVPSYLVYVLFQFVVQLANAVMPVVGLVLLFRRSRGAPTFFKVFLGFVIIVGFVEMSALRILYSDIAAAFQQVGDSLAPLDAARDQQLRVGLQQIAYGGIWLLYWSRSTKVKHLFAIDDVDQRA